jgi:twitching motility protein PilT
MALVESLLTAIMRADGDALVMHVGEKPYVVASTGPIELSSQGMNLQAMAGMVAQLLPEDAQRSLAEFGAVEHDLPAHPHIHDDRFSVVVARGGDDVWIEVRRHRQPSAAQSSAALTPVTEQATLTTATEVTPEGAMVSAPQGVDIPSDTGDRDEEPVVLPVDAPAAFAVEVQSSAAATMSEAFELPEAIEATDALDTVVTIEMPEVEPTGADEATPESTPALAKAEHVVSFTETATAFARVDQAARHDGTYGTAFSSYGDGPAAHTRTETPATFGSTSSDDARDVPHAQPSSHGDLSAPSATVIPMTRTLRIEVPPSAPARSATRGSDIERLLGLASARGATALYLTTQTQPHIRVDAAVRALDGERALTAADVDNAVLELTTDASRDAVRRGDTTEWTTDVAGLGPVRCSTFRDHRGPGAIFQLVSMRPLRAEQLGLSAEIQSLATEVEGLVVVATPPGNGKSALTGALVDLINRQRRSYIITLERQIRVLHEHQHALVSQREVGGAPEHAVAAARAALRENPDVLVVENLASAEMFDVALEAAGAGVLVLVTVTASSTIAALTRLIELVPADRRRETQALLADRFRGAVAQVLLHNTAGGRIAAREVLLSTATVTGLIADGQLQQLPRAIESGRKYGLVSLTDAFVQLLRDGAIDVRDAYRKTDDRAALLAALKRENIDTSTVERLA